LTDVDACRNVRTTQVRAGVDRSRWTFANAHDIPINVDALLDLS
jgi:hypothetical protein